MSRKKKRKKQKKLKILIIIILLIIAYIFYKFIFQSIFIPNLTTQGKAFIKEYYIYGTYLSIEGTIDNIDTSYDDIDYILYNGQTKKYNLEVIKGTNNIKFNFNSDINRGLYLENLKRGKYYSYIRVCYKNKSNKCKYKYYSINNKTKYNNTTYYTLSKHNNKIEITFNNTHKTMLFKVSRNNTKDTYDIIIDPGHGFIDDGAISLNQKYKEKDISLNISKLIYKKLKNNGLKVKLTRDTNTLKEDEYFEEYNVEGKEYTGRAVIPQKLHAKYAISIHLNSLEESPDMNGLELYTANHINYNFAKEIVKNIITKTEINPSTKEKYKVSEGIYTHNYTDTEIKNALFQYDKSNLNRYELTTNSNYLYMIRETGGYMTGAYIDDRNKKIGKNPYYDSNIGVETYLLELGYITNKFDLEYIINNEEKYAFAIAETIIKELNK